MTGITIFRLNEKMDEGDVLSSSEAPIRPDDTTGSLEARLAVLGADLLIETLERIDSIVPQAQDHALASPAPKLKKEFGLVDWSWDAAAVDRHVRAMNPWPRAFTFWRGERLIVLEGRPQAADRGGADQTRPGIVLEAGKTGLRILCGGSTEYRITRLQPEGRTAMAASAFVSGGGLTVGDLLTAAPSA